MALNFYGYCGDCTVSGRVEFGGGRLSQYLESVDELVVEEATLHGLRGEAPIHLHELTLDRSEIYAVEVVSSGPPAPNNSPQRIHTVRHVMRFASGPYTFLGELHALPGAQPLRSLLHRRSMVPLTECAVVFHRSGKSEVRRAAVVIINGALIDVAEPARMDDLGSDFVMDMAEPLPRT